MTKSDWARAKNWGSRVAWDLSWSRGGGKHKWETNDDDNEEEEEDEVDEEEDADRIIFDLSLGPKS